MKATRRQLRKLARDNAKQPRELQEVPRELWPTPNAPQMRVLRSRDFLVQEFAEAAPLIVRLSICRTTLSGERRADRITWDDLQRLKRECGYGDYDAVEVYPADTDIVNVANMRHLWVTTETIPFAWRKNPIGKQEVVA